MNQGSSGARNVGISRATGDYVGFIDADDTVSPDWLENAANAIYSSTADMVRLDPWDKTCEHFVTSRKILESGFSWLVFVRKGVLASMQECFPTGMRLREDTIFLLRTLKKASCTHQKYATGYFYRANTNSNVYAIQRVADFKRFVDELLAMASGLEAKDVSAAIYKSFLWWRTQRDKNEDGADGIAAECLSRAHREGVFLYRHAPLLWGRGFWLTDVYIALRRYINPKWLP